MNTGRITNDVNNDVNIDIGLKLICYKLTEESSWVTDQIIAVDGGRFKLS